MAVAVKGPSVGIPVKLFREAESHPVTVELKSGDVYRGTLEESEDSMSCLLKAVHHTARDGRVVRLEAVYLRGSQIRFVVLPELLKGAPLFQCVGGREEREGQRRAASWGRRRLAATPLARARATSPTRARLSLPRARVSLSPRISSHSRAPSTPSTPFCAAQKSQAVCRGQGQAAGVGSRAGRAGRAGRARRRAGQGPRRQERHSCNKCVKGGGTRLAGLPRAERPTLSSTRLTPPSHFPRLPHPHYNPRSHQVVSF
jgi:small nuclear ribonucleoprotein D3